MAGKKKNQQAKNQNTKDMLKMRQTRVPFNVF